MTILKIKQNNLSPIEPTTNQTYVTMRSVYPKRFTYKIMLISRMIYL